MGQDNSKKQSKHESPQPPESGHSQVSSMLGTSVDQMSEPREKIKKVPDNNNLPLSRSGTENTMSEMSTPVQPTERGEGLDNIEVHTVLLKQNSNEPGNHDGSIAIAKEATEQLEAAKLNTSDEDDDDDDEAFQKSMYNMTSVFSEEGGKESWQDSNGYISNIFPLGDTTENTDSLSSQRGNRGDNCEYKDKDSDSSLVERDRGPVATVNGLTPTLQDAYNEFQALFSYVNDLKVSNRRLMKRLTEEQQRYKKMYAESEAKVSGLEDCVDFLEKRVDQRDGQIKKLKGIIQVLLQKVSHLSSALGDLPGENGHSTGSDATSEEEMEEDSSERYTLPKPMTDKVTTPAGPSNQELGFHGIIVAKETDNRANCTDEISSKVLKRAVRERSKAKRVKVGGLVKPSEASSVKETGNDQKGQRSQFVRKDEKADQNVRTTTKSEAHVRTAKSKEPRVCKRPPRQVPIQNEFRNTLTEVTNMVKEPSSIPRPFSMDISSWITEANAEIMKGAESTAPYGRGPNVVLCLDISQSMEGRPFLDMIQGVLKFINDTENINLSLGYQTNIAIVTFGHKTAVLHHLTNNYSVLRDTVRNLFSGGTSPLTAALLLSTAASIGHGHNVTVGGFVQRTRICVFTDGRATLESRLLGDDIPLEGDFSYEVLHTMLGVTNEIRSRKVTVSYVPVGDFYPRYMEQVAEITGGKRYCMGELDKPIRHPKNFAFAVKLMPLIKEATGGNLKDPEANRLILTSVASKDPFVTKEDEEDILDIISKVDDLEKSFEHESDSDDEGHRELECDMPPLGTRVRRGPDWSWDQQDSNMAGTVVSHKSNGWLWVIWDSGYRNQYCCGKNGKFDVIPVDEPRILNPGETIQIGCMVRRGPDWQKGNIDGGEGSFGSVIHMYPNKTLLVRWPNKQILDHNYGCDNKFEVMICDPSEQLAMMMQASYTGGTTCGDTFGATGGATGGGSGDGTGATSGVRGTDSGGAPGGDSGGATMGETGRRENEEMEEEDYISKLNRLNQRNTSSVETITPSESSISGHSEKIPRGSIDGSSGDQYSSRRTQSEISPDNNLQNNLPHSGKPPDDGENITNVSHQTRHTDNIIGLRVDRNSSRVSQSGPGQSEGNSTTGQNIPNIGATPNTVTSGRQNIPNIGATPTTAMSGRQNIPNIGATPTATMSGRQNIPNIGATPTVTSGERSEDRSMETDTGAAEVEKHVIATWQYKDEYGGWTCYSEENNKKIEKAFLKSANRGTAVINGGKHRILLSKMMQVHTTTKSMTAVRRQVR
ncbi:uncharacterized protein [Argopecten irradians]|uniref:uncharacterized protein n=1 Tax=Argopecten irradians TaxID=31199 RepID=UPI00371E0A34